MFIVYISNNLFAITYHYYTHAEKLIKAPCIIIGKVKKFTHKGNKVVQYRGRPVKVKVLNASIYVHSILKGKFSEKELIIKNLLRPKNLYNHIGCQLLVRGDVYVFFLTNTDKKHEFDPINHVEFALEIKKIPEKKTGSVKQTLRHIAKLNIDSDSYYNDLLAQRWFVYLGEQFEPGKDIDFLLDKANHPRLRIGTLALTVLGENSPRTPSLYSKTIKFIKDTSKNKDFDNSFHYDLIQCLPAMCGRKGPTRKHLKEWLKIDFNEKIQKKRKNSAERIQDMALEIIIKRRDKAMIDDVTELMLRSKNRDIQYKCTHALSFLLTSLFKKRKKYTSRPNFMKNPEHHVNEWKKLRDEYRK